jgi:hypothetical protein
MNTGVQQMMVWAQLRWIVRLDIFIKLFWSLVLVLYLHLWVKHFQVIRDRIKNIKQRI